MVEAAFEKINDMVSKVPEEVKAQAKLNYFKRLITGDNKEEAKHCLFIAYCYIFQFILREEGRGVPKVELEEWVLLMMLEFCQGITYDKVFDDRNRQLLPLANILNRHYTRLTDRLDVDIDEAKEIFDNYYYEQVTLPIGKIEMRKAFEHDRDWQRVLDGFYTSLHIMNTFLERFNLNKRWGTFFKWLLLHRQINDDVLDLPEDYRKGELKSYGILGLVKKFGKKSRVNLNNPITALRYQLYMLFNYKDVYKALVERFDKELGEDGFNVDEFYLLGERMEEFIFSQL